jgi:hypothetical protein
LAIGFLHFAFFNLGAELVPLLFALFMLFPISVITVVPPYGDIP